MLFFKFSRNNQVVTDAVPMEAPSQSDFGKEVAPEPVNRAELVRLVAKEVGITKAESEKVLDAFLDAISVSLEEGKRVRLSGFGQFSVRRSKRDKFRNPRTGGRVSTVARPTVRFKPSATLKQAMNS